MTDYDINHLKELPVPPPRPEAKTRAIAAAMTAFEEEIAGQVACESCGAVVPSNSRFCVECGRRLRAATTTWRLLPRTAIAASIALLLTGGLVTLMLDRPSGLTPITKQPLSAQVPNAQETAKASPYGPPQKQSQSWERLAAAPPIQRSKDQASWQLGPKPIPAMPPRRVEGLHASDIEAEQKVEQLRLSGLRYRNSYLTGLDQASNRVGTRVRTNRRARIGFNAVRVVANEPVSTFSTNVDRGHLAFIRRELEVGRLPPQDAIRVGDLINAFHYAYPNPEDPRIPLRLSVTVLPSPWNPATKLIHIAIRGYPSVISEGSGMALDKLSLSSPLIAQNAKISIEFNPDRVVDYRLINGSSNIERNASFDTDPIGEEFDAGQTFTAIYEITPLVRERVASLRKSPATAEPRATASKDKEYADLTIHFHLPGEKTTRSVELAITEDLEKPALGQASDDVRFSIAVAAFGQMLRNEPYFNTLDYDTVIALANVAEGEDPRGDRAEFLNLLRLARSLRP